MPNRIHFVRHGEVENPDGILYGRLPGFGLSSAGAEMAALTAEALRAEGRPVARLLSSPLQRAVESAAPIEKALGIVVETVPGLTEASSRLEGGRFAMKLSILAKPAAWPYLVNPFRPSWGEPFTSVRDRTLAVFESLRDEESDGDVVVVGHQLPIWVMHRHATGKPLFHDPRKRRCGLSSVTSFEWSGDRLVEVGYREPAARLYARSADVGAV
jgi:broad specificity phosphatase PhoE